MANRTVSVALRLQVADYLGPAEKAAQATDKIGSAATRSAATHQQGMRAITMGAGLAAAAGALGLHKIVSASMDFERAMSNVGAVADASAGDLQRLSDAAIQAGADTAFSATEAATAEAELAKAGVSTSDILGGALKGSLDLAAAGQLDLGNAATISANAMNIFGMAGSDVGHIADVLAAGANKSAADVDQLAQAMSQGGQVAASMGLDLQDTVGALSMFADAGMKGSDAGTSLKTALQRLAAPSAESAATMKQLGLDAFDAQGNFVGLASFAGQLQKRLGGLTQEQRNSALATIFGADAVRAANILYTQGADGVRDYTTAVNDQGAAARNAAKQQANLAGDLEKLGGSIDTALIKTGSGANSVLRGLTQQATDAVNAFADMPGPVQAAATGVLAVGTAGAGLIAVLGTAVPRINAGRAALQEMGRAGEIANTAVGKIGKGVAIGSGALIGIELLSVGVGKLQDALVDTPPMVNELTASLLRAREWGDISKALGGNVEDLGLKIRHIADPSTTQSINKLFAGVIGQAPRSLREAESEVGALDQALSGLVTAGHGDEAARQFELIAQAAVAGGASVDQVRKALPLYRDAVAAAGNASELSSHSVEKVATAAGGAEPSLSGMQRAAQALGVELTEATTAAELAKSAIDRLNGASLGALDADIAFRGALAGVTAAIKDNGRTLNINTEAGRANLSAVSDAIRRASEHAQAVADQTGSVDRGTAAFGAHIAQLRATAIAAGIPRAAVDRLIAAYGKVPARVETGVSAPGAARAKGQADAVTTAANKIPRSRATQVSAPGATDAAGKMNRVTQLANQIPEREATSVSAPGAESAAARMNAVTRAANGIPSHVSTTIETIYRTVDLGGGRRARGPGMNAAGTPYWEGGLTWAGERGPELLDLPRGTAIYDAATSRAIADGLRPAEHGLPARSLRPAGAAAGPVLSIGAGAVQVTMTGQHALSLRDVQRTVDGALDQFARKVTSAARKGPRA